MLGMNPADSGRIIAVSAKSRQVRKMGVAFVQLDMQWANSSSAKPTSEKLSLVARKRNIGAQDQRSTVLVDDYSHR
jgi:hypothetical protein